MAMILDAFVGNFIDKLTSLFAEKAGMVMGVKDELERLKRRMERIQKFLEAAERRRLMTSSISDINYWVSELKDVFYDADDILDLYRTTEEPLLLVDQPSSSKKAVVCFNFSSLSSCFTSVPRRYQIAESIKSLNDRLEEIDKDRLRFNLEESAKQNVQTITVVNTRQTTPSIEYNVVGSEIEEATKELVTLMVQEQKSKCRVFAVAGMGGIGKTTLAQKIYNDMKIQAQFQIKVFVCVSHNYDEIALFKQVIRGAGGSCGENITSKTELDPLLQSAVNGKSLFLVLDDAWMADVWISLFRNPLLSAATIVRILVTTRYENVAREMGAVHTHRVNVLSDQTSWKMLCRWLFDEGQENEFGNLKGIGMQIVKKCSGLPLAIKAIAGVLARKERNIKDWEMVLKNDAWSMSNRHEELPAALYLSYDDLPSHLKQCFVYCSLFPEDMLLYRYDLVRLWVAEGFVNERRDLLVEEVAEEYYNELISRNLLQPNFYDATICTMHDLFRSLAKSLSHDEIFSKDEMAVTTTSSRTKLRRLSIENEETISRITGLIVEQKCLRTLLTFNCINVLNDNQLVGFARLRVLQINRINIKSIPNSIGDLKHLRYLSLPETQIKELPESIGSLINLQFLILSGCFFLTTLPESITKLQNLRCLDLDGEKLSFISKGISKLEKINHLNGFVVADPRKPEGSYSSLEELNSLYQLRKLSISKMERAQKGALSLQKLTRLVELQLFYTHVLEFSYSEQNRPLPTEEDIKRIEVLEELCPPQCLERLRIINFNGSRYPSWMQSPSFGERLPSLTQLELNGISCPQLPPAGELPQLSKLIIINATSVKRIGSEFLGVGVGHDTHPATRTAFPNLKSLVLSEMDNLEEWTFNTELEGFEPGRGQTLALPRLLLLPRLDRLNLYLCPKLKALPKGLEQSSMKELHIVAADRLRALDNFPKLMEKLSIFRDRSLERVSHLPALKVLLVNNCPALNCVEKLDSLQRLELEMEKLPEWLPRLLEERKPADDDDFLFVFKCSDIAFSRLLKGGPDWPIIERIPQVIVSSGSKNLLYTRNPFNYELMLKELIEKSALHTFQDLLWQIQEDEKTLAEILERLTN